MAADTCRLCLRPIDQAKSSDLLTETTKLAMLKEFLPEMNLDITENTEVCNNCMEELETSFNFKNGVVVNEANIQAKLEGKKQKKIDLKLMLDDVAKKELKKSDYICRTCLSICKSPSISLFDSPSNMMPYSFVKKMCEVVFELELIASAKPVLCDDCWETLQTVYNFRKSCLRTDERLRIYVGTKNVTKLSIGDFKKFAEENPVKDEDEDFSDEELDGYVKDEPIDEEELKIDPEEASCSSSSVKVKQETEVKSESELNSDDEVKEDEPELLDPKAVKSEADGLDGGDCKMEIGDVKVDAEGGDAAGTSGEDTMATTSHKEVLERHLKTYKPNSERSMFTSAEGSETFDNKQNFLNHPLLHMETDKIKGFLCSHCPYKTTDKSLFGKHQKIHKPNSERQKFICAECSKVYTEKRGLLDHIFRVHKRTYEMKGFVCSHCSYKTLKKTAFRTHQEIHKPNTEREMFYCKECSKEFMAKQSLQSHILLEHKEINHKFKNILCSHCPYIAENKIAFQQHQEIHKPNLKRSNFTCAECFKVYTKKKSLLDHILRMHKRIYDIKSFSCVHCPYKTIRKSVFLVHQDTHKPNSERNMFYCTQCPKQFMRKWSMRDHILRVHKGPYEIKSFSCSHCVYKSTDKFSLRIHEETHQPISGRRMFTCAECSKMYTRKRSLLDHILRVHKTTYEMKSFSCLQCPFKTVQKSVFRLHQETHKPFYERQMFTCAECSKQFKRKSGMFGHISRIHKGSY